MPATLPAATSPTISLSASDRERLYVYEHRGHSSTRTRTRAQVLLKLGEGWSDAAVCQAFDVCRNTVKHVRARFATGGVEAVLTDKRQERRYQALHRRPTSPSRRDCVQRRARGARPLDLTDVGGQSRRIGLCRAYFHRDHPLLIERTNSNPSSIASGASRR